MKKKRIFLFVLFIIIIVPNFAFAKDIVVILDPGHGGGDAGTTWENLKEKDITWKIANKVKEIFDSTPGITGFLARKEDDCPSLKERGLFAKSYNADLLVSFHINSSTLSNSARGAEVYITGDTTEDRFNKNSKILGNDILKNLKSMGIPSFWYEPRVKYSTDGELYDDGMLSDYYGIIRNPMYYKIPGVLIEHCFMNHVQDRTNFLSNDSAIYEMAKQDAYAIIKNKELFRKKYRGDVATQITQLELNKNSEEKSYISGEILITEWIDGVTWSVPRDTPKIKVKATDGSFSYEMWVSRIEGNKYYFDGYIDGIDPNKKYEIEVESGSEENTSPYRIAKGYYNENKVLGQYRRHLLKIENNIVTFIPTNYCGDIATQIINTNLAQNEQGRPYLSGEIYITEWLKTIWTVPDVVPEITIISTDNSSKQQFWVVNIEGNKYYFDGYIDGLDMSKEYVIKVKLNNTYNTSKYQTENVIYKTNIELGRYEDRKIIIEDNKIWFEGDEYQGDIATQIDNIELIKGENGTYLRGEIFITEWINGVKWSIPRETPQIRIKEINGTESYELWVVQITGNKYYFDGYIDGIDTQKEYEIEVESGSIKNMSKYRIEKGYYNKNKKIGTYQNNKVIIENNKILFKLDTYQGDIATQIDNIEIINSEKGNYIKGEIFVTEWIDGIKWSIPKEIPKIRIKEVDGIESYELWGVQVLENKYYFDGYIDEIDTQKEYIIEVESGSTNNISKYRIGKGYFNQNTEIGIYQNTKVVIENSIIRFYNSSGKSVYKKIEIQENLEEGKNLENDKKLEINEKNIEEEIQNKKGVEDIKKENDEIQKENIKVQEEKNNEIILEDKKSN